MKGVVDQAAQAEPRRESDQVVVGDITETHRATGGQRMIPTTDEHHRLLEQQAHLELRRKAFGHRDQRDVQRPLHQGGQIGRGPD